MADLAGRRMWTWRVDLREAGAPVVELMSTISVSCGSCDSCVTDLMDLGVLVLLE